MDNKTITVKLLKRWHRGDQRAEHTIYCILQARFLSQARYFLHDEHKAHTAFNDAFIKLKAAICKDFAYQGKARFYSYFSTILHNACRNQYRADKPNRDWESEHLLPSAPADGDGEDPREYVERVVGYDLEVEEAKKQRNARIQEELQQHLETHLTPQDRRFWEAYRALTETPGSDRWGDHEKTAFLKRYLDLPESTFYPAHTRFKKRIRPFARHWRLVSV